MLKDEFKALQRKWYKLLEESGFKDIEEIKGDELVLKQIAPHSFWADDEFSRYMKSEYFRAMSQAFHDPAASFKNEVDRLILSRHIEGQKIIAIAKELTGKGLNRNRASVRFIIRRYEVAWGIKEYEPEQLNKKRNHG